MADEGVKAILPTRLAFGGKKKTKRKEKDKFVNQVARDPPLARD